MNLPITLNREYNMKEFVEHKEFKNPPSDLFKQIACNLVDFYNTTQICIGSEHRMEYPKMNEDIDYDERKETLKQYHIKDINNLIFEANMTEEEEKEYKENQIQFILDNNLDLR